MLLQGGDCNDLSNLFNPSIAEVCDGLDNDCDGTNDNGLTFATYYQDLDNDGFGAGTSVFTCANPGLGYVNQGGDCDDANPAMYPLNAEICDDLDNNCDGQVDNGVSFTNYFVDNDGDGFGVGLPVSVCVDPGAGYSLTANDCDDSRRYDLSQQR
jgi:hypothetical protein